MREKFNEQIKDMEKECGLIFSIKFKDLMKSTIYKKPCKNDRDTYFSNNSIHVLLWKDFVQHCTEEKTFTHLNI